jgi:hypothetical protein
MIAPSAGAGVRQYVAGIVAVGFGSMALTYLISQASVEEADAPARSTTSYTWMPILNHRNRQPVDRTPVLRSSPLENNYHQRCV